MIKYAKKNSFKVSFTSNFTYINQFKVIDLINSKVDLIYISVDGATKTTFEKIRVGAIFEEVMSNIKLFTRIKKERNTIIPLLYFYVTLLRDNLNEIREIVKLAEVLKIDTIDFNRMIMPGKEYWKSEIPIIYMWKKITKNKININKRAIPLKKCQPCVALIGCYITFNGKVLPCNRITQILPRKEYPPYIFGDLENESLTDIWFSQAYKNFRKNLAMGIYPDICKYCTQSRQF